jgi:hypothetical protein
MDGRPAHGFIEDGRKDTPMDDVFPATKMGGDLKTRYDGIGRRKEYHFQSGIV